MFAGVVACFVCLCVCVGLLLLLFCCVLLVVLFCCCCDRVFEWLSVVVACLFL